VVIEQDGNAVKLSGYAQVLKKSQAAFAPYRVPGRSAVDELIAERGPRPPRTRQNSPNGGRPPARDPDA